MNYQNYIFDLYGTLVDIHTDESKASVWKKIAVYFSAQGAAYTGKEIKERYGALIDAEAKKLQRKLNKKYPGIAVKEVEINLDRVFVNLYKEKGITLTAEIPQIQKELTELQEAVLTQNEKNRTLLKEHITQIRNRISNFSDPRRNPYAKNTSIYSQKVSTPSIIDVEI